jgi:hemerythrin-like domain-containing protein
MRAFPRLAAGAVTLGFFAGLAFPQARKAIAQAPDRSRAEWVEALTAEHRRIRKLFDRLMETRNDQAAKRELLLARIARALAKHAAEEEYVIYPALMESVRRDEAKQLFDDHGEMKHFIYDLRRIPASQARWLVVAQEFRDHLDEHMRREEVEVFPSFHDSLSAQENLQLTRMMNAEGYKLG